MYTTVRDLVYGIGGKLRNQGSGEELEGISTVLNSKNTDLRSKGIRQYQSSQPVRKIGGSHPYKPGGKGND